MKIPYDLLTLTVFFQMIIRVLTKKNVLVLPSFIMAVNRCYFSIVQIKSNKVHPSIKVFQTATGGWGMWGWGDLS